MKRVIILWCILLIIVIPLTTFFGRTYLSDNILFDGSFADTYFLLTMISAMIVFLISGITLIILSWKHIQNGGNLF